MMLTLDHSKTILITCHDTGAANALVVFVRYLKDISLAFRTVCSGSSVDVFSKAGVTPDKTFSDALGQAEVEQLFDEFAPQAVLFGTSLDSMTDRLVCSEARRRGIYAVALVDWWANFGRRFSSPGTCDLAYLPDAIAVEDEDALAGSVEDGIPEHLLRVIGNPYWGFIRETSVEALKDIRYRVRAILNIPVGVKLVVIFSSALWKLDIDLGYNERDFLSSVDPLPVFDAMGVPVKWLIKPHPMESVEEVATLLKNLAIRPGVLEGVTAVEAIAASDMVLGMCSSALLEAVLLGKTVASLQPGLIRERTKFLRILERLGIPEIITAEEARAIVNNLINKRVSLPDLENLSFPVSCEIACKRLHCLLVQGMKNHT